MDVGSKITNRGPYCPYGSAEPSDGLQVEELNLRNESCPYILELSPATVLIIGEYGYNADGAHGRRGVPSGW